ncbi:MAG TPA: hypothetical protein VGK73_33700, partial [Polyangiaceae bacterium]
MWSVPWSGTLHNDPALSRDGRLAVVWVYTRGERRPFLFRMQEPVGPLRELTDLVPGFPIDATWAPDSRHVLLLCERTRYASELELALLDLAQSRVTARWPIADAGRAEGPLGFVAGTELVFAVRDATLRS